MRGVLLLVVSFLFFACTTDEGESPRKIVNGKYSNKTNGVSLQFPANWKFETDKKYGGTKIDFIAVGPVAQGFSPNVNIIIKPFEESADWTQILGSVKLSLQTSFPDFGNYAESIKEVGGVEYAEIGYTASESGTLFEFIQIIVLNRNTATTITFTDLATRFDSNADFKGILSSLAIE